MWQYWQHNISEEAKKYGYGEDKILRESKIKAAAEAWFNSLPKECLAELKQRVGKAIAAANTKNVPLLPTDLMNIQLILKAHKVKPLLGSMQASITAVETMMQPDRLESVEVTESIEAVGNTDKGGYSHWTNHTKVIRTFSWMHRKTGRSVSSGGAVPWLTPAEKSEWEENAYFVFYDTVNGTTFGGRYDTEKKAQAALDKAKRDHQKEVAKYVTAPQVRKRIQELENEIAGVSNSPSMAGGAVRIKRLEDEIKRLKQQLRSLGVKRESVEVVENFNPSDYGYRVDQDTLYGPKDKPFVLYKLSYSQGSIRFMDGRKGTVISRFATKNEALAQAKRLAKKEFPTAEIESVEVIGDTIAEGSESYDVEGTVDNSAGGQRSARTMEEAEHYAKVMLDFLKKGSPKAKKITVVIYKVVNYQRKNTPEKVLTVTEGIDVSKIDINEAKKKLTPEQKAALKAYKLSCDMRDRDDITPDAYRHYEKRAKADVEACKKLGLGKEDGVYESVEVAEATAHWLRNSKRPLLGTFTHATTGVRFDYRMSDDDYGKKHGLPHEVHVGVNSTSGETRPAFVKGTVCIIGVDEGADGKPVLEKWKIKQHVIYPIHHFRVGEKPEKWTKGRASMYRGEEFESEEPSLIEATYSKSKAKLRKKIADGIKKFITGETNIEDLMRLIGTESKDHPTIKKAMAKMNDRVGKRITIDWKA
jgi:hypothetical protein